MWILPEEVRARQAVMEGIGRAVRELYKVQHFEVVSHSMRKLLEELDLASARSKTTTGTSEPARNTEQRQ